MATVNPRINVSLSPEEYEIIRLLSEKHQISQSAVIKKMVEDWIDEYEEMKLAERAEKAHEHWIKSGKQTYSHEEVCRMFGIE